MSYFDDVIEPRLCNFEPSLCRYLVHSCRTKEPAIKVKPVKKDTKISKKTKGSK